jgi:tRNA modification GTPase
MTDTIAALSTPFGEGAIAVIRVSGPGALAIADGVFQGRVIPSAATPRTQHLGKIVDGESALDDVLLSVFRGPASYTGEDVFEINCHGGILVSRRILQLLLGKGVRLAEPGEFTQRAFLNGKMDLTQAEAVMDLIRAQTDLALRAATEQLEGRIGSKVQEIREQLLELLAHVEAYIDFPEEDISPDMGAGLLKTLDAARESIARLLRTADQGRVLRQGVRTVICGAPNVGKSSLLNLLLGCERAIVSEIAGTTRDTIEEVINLRGIPLRLVDTAGLRETHDPVERQGIERTRKHLESADLVLHVFDASTPPGPEAREAARAAHTLLVLNKVDLGVDPLWGQALGSGPRADATDETGPAAARIACKTGEGIEQLTELIFQRVMGGKVNLKDLSLAINARHQDCLKRAAAFCEATRAAIVGGVTPELVAIDLRDALEAIGEIVGKADTEELLGKIFSTFCIGK